MAGMTGMIENWWSAHELEYVVAIIVLAVVFIPLGVYLLWDSVADYFRRKRKLDDQYRQYLRDQGQGD